jgi:signal transduction histidine kinase/ActR/RegA family two-component response regulator
VAWEHKARGTFKLLSPDYSRRGGIRDIGSSAWQSCKAAANRLSIPGRLGLLVLALALPLNLIIVGAILGLVERADDAQRTSLLYATRSIAAGVDAELGKFIALAESLARSPALLDHKLDDFEAEARREFPQGAGAWVLVADVNGKELINTLAQPGEPLPRRNPAGIEAERHALATNAVVVSDAMLGVLVQDWVVNIEVPIYKNGQPFRGLILALKQQHFIHLLNARDIPTSWLAAIIDGQGRFIARVPKGATEVGQLASEGWRATKDRTGIFEYPSLEGDMLIAAHAHPRIGNWTVGVAVKKAELRAAVWSTVRWAALLGTAISAASLLLAVILARQITRPIESLRQSFSDVPVGPVKPIVVGPPEIMELQDTLYRAAAERQSANQALMEALSKLEHEMALREDAQAALAKSQRMEAVGQLAGGMAHDFNNVLAAISANLDMVTVRSKDEKIHQAVQAAMDAIQMGASLNQRLLSFSGRREQGLEGLDLNKHVTGTVDLLRRTLGDRVTVALKCSPDPCNTLANPGDVDNAILNLAINARDAMPNGGMVTMETCHVTLDTDAAARIVNARPGEFIRLSIGDTGRGMTREVLKRAMEPFFTTKEQGSGLGLATVYGAIQHSGGFVAIQSALGKGTDVHLYFPKAEAGWIVSQSRFSAHEASPEGHGERILLVEDNDRVREATDGRLESLGYAVLEAKTGVEAIKLLETGEQVALVFSDIALPGSMTGYDVAEWVRSNKPDLKVLLTTGYSEMPLAASEVVRAIRVVRKPYTREQLARALREAIQPDEHVLAG